MRARVLTIVASEWRRQPENEIYFPRISLGQRFFWFRRRAFCPLAGDTMRHEMNLGPTIHWVALRVYCVLFTFCHESHAVIPLGRKIFIMKGDSKCVHLKCFVPVFERILNEFETSCKLFRTLKVSQEYFGAFKKFQCRWRKISALIFRVYIDIQFMLFF